VAHAQFLTEGLREHADVVFPAEAYAEKEGTVTHPDGRLQRLRSAIAHPARSAPEWQVIADVARRAGLDLRGADGAWPARSSSPPCRSTPASRSTRSAARACAGTSATRPARPSPTWCSARSDSTSPTPVPQANGRLRLGTFRSIWASEEVLVSPALRFLHPSQRVEMSPADAQRLDVAPGRARARGRRRPGRHAT
jgi:NADH-quinone oxidoreductase subunit G